MNYLGISLGTKNMKTLRREDIEEAFITSFVDSVYVWVLPQCDNYTYFSTAFSPADQSMRTLA